MDSSTKFMVVSGFLGSGKTTTMMAISKFMDLNKKKASIVINDLGANLVDTKYSSKKVTLKSSIIEIPSGCICYQMDNLMDKLYRIKKEFNPDLIMSDIPGCGVGALDHVYHKINNEFSVDFTLSPFMVVLDPERLNLLKDQSNSIKMHINSELIYLLKKQLEEADLIVLNKIDLLSDAEIDENVKFISSLYNVPIIPISSKFNINIDSLVNYILNNVSSLKKIDIDNEKFLKAENLLSWYNRKIIIKSEAKVDILSLTYEFIELIKSKLIENNANTLHLKIFVGNINDKYNDFIKASLIGVDHDIELDNNMNNPTNNMYLILNMRSIIDSNILNNIVDQSINFVASKFNVTISTMFLESFGVMDPK